MSSKNRYPKSKNGFQCLSRCYKENSQIIHPITLDSVIGYNEPFCAIEPQNDGTLIDACYYTKSSDDNNDDVNDILLPQIDFNCSQFLKTYYGINTYVDALDWIAQKNNSPIFTKLRIMDCVLTIYGDKINILDTKFTEFYTEVIKKLWIYNVYEECKKYIKIEDNKIFFSKLVDPNDFNKNKKEKLNFLVDKFSSPSMIYKFMEKYFNEYKSSWNDINLHHVYMQKYFVKFTLNKIITVL